MMGYESDDDRPKKSWREIDQSKDSSKHHQTDRTADFKDERRQRSGAYRQYKAQLDKVFSGAGLPDALKEKLGETEAGKKAKEKKKGLKAILEAKAPRTLKSTLKAFKDEHGFPQDEEVLAKLLDLSNERIVQETLDTLLHLQAEGALKRARSLKGRLNTVKITMDDPAILKRVEELLAKL
jgi:hypothetical protein